MIKKLASFFIPSAYMLIGMGIFAVTSHKADEQWLEQCKDIGASVGVNEFRKLMRGYEEAQLSAPVSHEKPQQTVRQFN